jgi:hypothetical protein
VENITTYFAATAVGAAFPGAACSAWATPSRVGDNPARLQIAALAAGQPAAGFAALRHGPVPTMRLVPMAKPLTVAHSSKQTHNVHKTRINAGGYGAMGPHPERETGLE